MKNIVTFASAVLVSLTCTCVMAGFYNVKVINSTPCIIIYSVAKSNWQIVIPGSSALFQENDDGTRFAIAGSSPWPGTNFCYNHADPTKGAQWTFSGSVDNSGGTNLTVGAYGGPSYYTPSVSMTLEGTIPNSYAPITFSSQQQEIKPTGDATSMTIKFSQSPFSSKK